MNLLLAWLATYALHSTLLLGAVWLLTTFIVRRDGWRDALWKAALVGSLVTTTLQLALDLRPVTGRWAIPTQASGVDSRLSDPGRQPGAHGDETLVGAEPSVSSVVDSRLSDPGRQPGAPAAPQPRPATMLTLTWSLIAFILLARLGYRHLRLHRVLGPRRPVSDAAALALLTELRRHAGVWRDVRLSVTDRCSTPLALGTREICVPARLLGLPVDELRGALAHELAHLTRRDPLWQLGAGVLEAVFFFQPLNRLARLRLREAAEHLSDDWAVHHTGSAVSLARCLAAVASWVAPGDPVPHTTTAMAEGGGGSALVRRVQRLLAARGRVGVPARWLRTTAGATLVAAMLGVAPLVSSRSQSPTPPATPSPSPSPRPSPSPSPSASPSPSRSSPRGDQQQARVEIIEIPNELGSLKERFRMAVAEARRREHSEFWIAYAFEGTVGPFRTDSDARATDRTGGPTLGDVMYQGKWDRRGTRGDIVPLFRMSGPRLVRVAGRSYEQPAMSDQLPVYCLDDVTEEESLALLDSLLAEQSLGPIRNAFLSIIATHGSRRRGGIGARREAMDPADDPTAERVALTAHDYATARDNARRYGSGPDGLAVRRLAEYLDHEPLHDADLVRERAAWALARMESGNVVQPLIAALGSNDWRIRAFAAWGLGVAADRRALTPLRQALGDSHWRVRTHAIYGVGSLRDRLAVSKLIDLLIASQWQVRAAAAENLGLLGDRSAVPALERLLHDDHVAVTDAVETALARLR